jgi:hypothetical protein
MSSSYRPLTLPEQDAVAWYRLGDERPLRQIASIAAPYESPADDAADELIDMPEVA